MQIQQKIVQAFSKKGYFEKAVITKRQFQILMNTFISITNPHKLFNQTLANQIWKQTQDRVQKSNNSIKTQDLIHTINDAIQILNNRIIQCQDRIQELSEKKKKAEEDLKFNKVQELASKINTLKTDLEQFINDYTMLTEPFTYQNRNQMRFNILPQGKKSPLQRVNSPRAMMKNKTLTNQAKLFEQKMKQKFQALSASPFQNKQKITKSSVYQVKRCALYFLIFLMVLQITVSMMKFNFVNLIVFLIGFLVLLQQKFMPSMLKISIYSCFISLLLDGTWLYFYSKQYLNSQKNTGLKHQLKPYLQYIWFITLLQTFLKLIYGYFIRQYEVKSLTLQKIQQDQRRIVDKYIPKVREFAKEMQQKEKEKQKEKQKEKEKEKKSKYIKFSQAEDDEVTIN